MIEELNDHEEMMEDEGIHQDEEDEVAYKGGQRQFFNIFYTVVHPSMFQFGCTPPCNFNLTLDYLSANVNQSFWFPPFLRFGYRGLYFTLKKNNFHL